MKEAQLFAISADRAAEYAPAGTLLSDAVQTLFEVSGKGLRPALLISACQALGSHGDCGRSAAEAIELIHTYSLIHDDLPAMDDDDLRRGRPTLHVAYDEATAILVGDGLQAKAFELIACDEALSAEQRVVLIACLSKAAGFTGMVGGQSLDMEATARELSLDELQSIHALKTGALITAALEMGGIVAGASAEQRATLKAVGERIGLAFQIIDDVIDVRGDSASLGKTAGKDAESGKSTYVALMGLEAAETAALSLHEESLALLDGWGMEADELRQLLGKMVKRDR